MNMQVSHETITVESLTQYGVRVNGKNYNYSKFRKYDDLQVGKTYEADIYTSEKGAKYINEVKLVESFNLGSRLNIDGDLLDKARIVEGSKVTPNFDKEISKYGNNYDDKKNKRILVQGILQAVLQSQGLLMDVAGDYLDKVEKTTLRLVQFVEDNIK